MPTYPTLDPASCTSCKACEVACVTTRYPELGSLLPGDDVVLERRRLAIVTVAGLPSLNVCVHCEEAPCITVCPHDALLRFPDGRVELIEPRCTGCGHCISACTYRAIRRVTALGIAAKCDACVPLSAPGKPAPLPGGPSCAPACPTGALTLRQT